MDNKTTKDEIDNKYFLFGLLNAFTNRLQTVGDTFFEEISWKQWFVLIGISLYKKPPTINEVAEVIGSSHQNIKQILLKLEKIGFVELYTDELDRRKLRIRMTDRKMEFDKKYNRERIEFIEALYKGLNDNDIIVTMKTLSTMEQNLLNIER
jgi:DNA-binding MarR family transcriptional regulator